MVIFSVEVIDHAFENLPMSQIFSKIINEKHKHCSVTTRSFPFHPPLTLDVFVNTFRVNRDERHANHWKRCLFPVKTIRILEVVVTSAAKAILASAVWEEQANYVVGKFIQNVKQQIGSHTE
jgi:hypothetical protein